MRDLKETAMIKKSHHYHPEWDYELKRQAQELHAGDLTGQALGFIFLLSLGWAIIVLLNTF